MALSLLMTIVPPPRIFLSMVTFAFLYDLMKSLFVTKEVTQKKQRLLVPLLMEFRFT